MQNRNDYLNLLWLGTFARLTTVYSYSMDGSIRKKYFSFSIWLKSLQRYLRPISIPITKRWCIQIWYPMEKLISKILFARKTLFMSSLLRFANPYWSLLWAARMKYQTDQLKQQKKRMWLSKGHQKIGMFFVLWSIMFTPLFCFI